MVTIEFILNGQSVKVEPRADESLLETLRERCGIFSTKDGCSPQGQCGCCLAIVGGRAVVTCAMPASKAASEMSPLTKICRLSWARLCKDSRLPA